MFGVVFFAQKQVPQSPRLGLVLKLKENGRNRLPPLGGVFGQLVVVNVLSGETLGLEKVNEIDKGLFGIV